MPDPTPKLTAKKQNRSLQALDSVIAAEAHGRREAFKQALNAWYAKDSVAFFNWLTKRALAKEQTDGE